MRRLACVIIAILCVGCGGGGGTSGTTVGVPVFSPSPGTYATAQSVTLSTSTPGASIRYTTDGSIPGEAVGTVYAGPIAVASSVTIRAVAYLPGWTTSSVSSGTYAITGSVVAPVFSPSPGTYATAQSVTLSTSTPGATIRYTTDGSTPSETVGTMYAGAIAVASSVTIRAVAYLSGWTTSSVSNGGYAITEPKVNVTVGSREVVYDWTNDRCEDLDVPDGPARFVRAGDGTLVLFSGNAPRYYVSRGSDFSSLTRVCGQPALVSADKPTPESYENWEWLWAVYREGDKWHAFVHNEFHDNTSATCTVGVPTFGNPCWYNSVTYAVSSDDGRTFIKPNAPAHVVAPAPNAWVPPPVYPSEAYVAEGYFQPSSIVRGPDGYYYSLMLSIRDKSSGQGICAIRSDRLDDPTSWRAWDGSGFNLRLTSPYATGASATVCTYLPIAIGNESLSYNTYLGLYMLVGYSNMGPSTTCGFYFSLSPDMVHWGPKQLIAPARIPWCDAGPATPGVLEPVMVMYPSLIDHGDTGVNFDRTGRNVYLYYTRDNDDNLDRDLVRVPVTFTVE